MHATDYVRSLWKFIHMFSMIRTGTTLILGQDIKGQGQQLYFVCETILARNRLVLCAGLNGSPGRLLYVIVSSVRLFVCLSIRWYVISSRLHLKCGWLHSSQIWTVIHHRVAHPSSVDITCPFGCGRGQTEGLWAFARFWLCCHQGHPCYINKFYCPINIYN